MANRTQDAATYEDTAAGRQENATLSIGVVARMFRTSTLTLRLYELRGLIRRRRSGRDRLYSWFECERIALILKACCAGLRVSDIKRIIVGMDERSSRTGAEAGRQEAISLIHVLERRQQAIGNVLGELYRIDWELSRRLGVKSSGGADEADEMPSGPAGRSASIQPTPL
ncbi:MAG: MerR family transcriptional regulator [Pseudolabrys sp.]